MGEGVTVEVTGPFHVPPPVQSALVQPAGPRAPADTEGSDAWPIVGIGAAAAATTALGAAVWWRDRRRDPEGVSP